MSIVGIIAEYNPLHEGHAYHLRRAREITRSDACVCVLSSNFVQRGEPGIVSKWARARMALLSGADLVLELPSAFSCASAEYFASAGISLLESLQCVDSLCFGSESGNLDELVETANQLAYESDDFKKRLKSALDEGLSFAAAREKALLKAQGSLNQPNNILGIEYIKAIHRLGSTLQPVTVERKGENYRSLTRADTFSSATAIRRHLAEIKENPPDSVDRFLQSNMPSSCLDILLEEFAAGRGPVFPEAYEATLLHLLRTVPEEGLAALPYVNEGLENRLKEASKQATSYGELVSRVVTSRYPASRIKRILIALLTGMTGEFLDQLKSSGYVQYIRVLGFNTRGRKILSEIKRKIQLPLITKAAHYKKLGHPLAVRLFEHEARSTDAYVLGYPSISQRKGGEEFLCSPLYWDVETT